MFPCLNKNKKFYSFRKVKMVFNFREREKKINIKLKQY